MSYTKDMKYLSKFSGPPIMRTFFDLKVNQCNLCSNYLLKLPATSICRYGTHALCLTGNLLWNRVPSKHENINTFEEFKIQINLWDNIICS